MNKETNTIKKIGEGVYEVSISFDITEHGHSYGMPRNYPLNKVQALIRSKRVQDDIKNGYALSMYGHKARNKKQGYLANEANEDTGALQEPIGKITSLSIRDKIITYTMRLVETAENKTKSVAKLIENSIGGFSMVWDVTNGIFYGSDYVLSPNFNGNRVIMDSVCSGGECMLNSAIEDTVLDAIGEHKELYNEAKELLEHQDEVMAAIHFKEKVKAMTDSIKTLEAQVSEKENIIFNKEVDIKAFREEIDALKKSFNAINGSFKNALKENEALTETLEALNTEKNQTQKILDETTNALKQYGIIAAEGTVKMDKEAYGDFFKAATCGYQKEVDKITLDSLRTVSKQPKRETNLKFFYGK